MAVFAYIAALIVFVLTAVGYTFGSMSGVEMVGLGLAFLAAGFVVGPVVTYVEGKRA